MPRPTDPTLANFSSPLPATTNPSDYMISHGAEKDGLFYFIFFVYILLIFVSFSLNLNLFVLLIRGRRILLKKPFYLILFQLLIANILFDLALLLGDVPPAILLSDSAVESYIHSAIFEFFTIFDNIYEHAIQWFALVMALHRFIIICWPIIAEHFLTTRFFSILFVLLWFSLVYYSYYLTVNHCSINVVLLGEEDVKLESIVRLQFYCATVTNSQDTKNFFNETIKDPHSNLILILLIMIFIEKCGFSLLTLICYLIIGFKLAQIHKITGQSYKEKAIVQQGLTVFLLAQLTIFVFYISWTVEIQYNTVFYFRKIVQMVGIIEGNKKKLQADMLAGVIPIYFILATNKEINRFKWIVIDYRRGTTNSPS